MPLVRGARGAVVAPHHLATAAGPRDPARRAATRSTRRSRRTPCSASSCRLRCGIGGDAFWLIWDEAARPADRAQRLRAGAGRRRRRGARAPAAWTTLPVPRAAGDHGPRRRPLLGRRPRPARPAVAGGRPRAGDRARARTGFPAWDGFIGAVEATAPASRRRARPGRRASSRSTGRTGGPGDPASGFACRPWRRPSSGSPTDGFDDFYEGEIGERQAAGLAAVGCRSRRADLAGHTSTWSEPIATDYRGVRVTTHPPNSSGIVALELLEHPRDVRAAGARRPSGRTASTTRAGSTSGSRRPSSRWPIATST